MSKKVDTWYSLNLGDEPEAYQALAKITETFKPFFYAYAATKKYEMATFYKDDSKTHALTVYFPPIASEVAISLNATPCEKPSRSDLIILLADQRALDILYPASK